MTKAKLRLRFWILNLTTPQYQPVQIVAVIAVLTPKQSNFIAPIDPQKADLIQTNRNSYDEHKLAPVDRKNYKDLFGFKTPETCKNPKLLTGIEKRIYDDIFECKRQVAKNPLKNETDRNEIFSQFSWQNSVLLSKKSVEILFFSYHHIFGNYWLDVSLAPNFSVRLKPEHDHSFVQLYHQHQYTS